MFCTVVLKGIEDLSLSEQFIMDAAWAVCSSHHTVLDASPGATVFGQRKQFDLSYLAE